MTKCVMAYTGPMPERGYVGYVSVNLTDDGQHVKITVRSAGENPPQASVFVPIEAWKSLIANAAEHQ